MLLFIIGLFIGGFLAVFILSCCMLAKEDDDHGDN